MGGAAKAALFERVAQVGKAMGHPARLELLDLLAQGECPVEPLAAAAGLRLSTASAHLQILRRAGLVGARRDGTRIRYSLAGDDVAALYIGQRTVAAARVGGLEPARRAYLGIDRAGPADPAAEEIDRDELLRRLREGRATLLDLRPPREYAAGHIPGARSIPADELDRRRGELPAATTVVAYCRGPHCVLSYDAVRLLTRHGHLAVRLVDGVLEWRLAGLPVESGAA